MIKSLLVKITVSNKYKNNQEVLFDQLVSFEINEKSFAWPYILPILDNTKDIVYIEVSNNGNDLWYSKFDINEYAQENANESRNADILKFLENATYAIEV